ncbi:MAG TPA: FkbM family methyltransferase [Rhizomicrobium sp.]|nr:FkbM family methyltransferase [Rhizomicrobium sp.]
MKKALTKAGYQVTRSRPTRNDFLISREIDTIVDVGANIGQFGKEVRSEGFRGRIFSFEPIPQVHRILSQNLAHDPQWRSYCVGLSDKRGSALINVSSKTVFSSLQPIRSAALDFDVDAAAVSRQEITLSRLEDFDQEIGGRRVFLKIDTQGHEQKVLRGAGEILERLHGIQLELPISALYEETWTIAEAMAWMRSSGFLPTSFCPVNYHHRDPMAIVEVDCIFRRFNSEID